jgi:hypothetical protein
MSYDKKSGSCALRASIERVFSERATENFAIHEYAAIVRREAGKAMARVIEFADDPNINNLEVGNAVAFADDMLKALKRAEGMLS